MDTNDPTVHLGTTVTGGGEPRDIIIPSQLGPVQLLHEIGRGGMGAVYLGRHEMLNKDVAVKFLLHAVSGRDDPGFVRFLEGARAAAAVSHNGLNMIHHADLIEDIPYLVLDYIDGPGVSDIIKRRGALSLPVALFILAKTASALSSLHKQEIVHRDIKSSNVMVRRDLNILVTDFGLTCNKPSGRKAYHVERLAGSPPYMSPESFDGVISLKSDVYSLGIMAFELLTGKVPFSGTLEDMAELHRQEPLPIGILEEHSVPQEIVEIIERATHKNPVFRYKSAIAFEQAIMGLDNVKALLHKGEEELSQIIFAQDEDDECCSAGHQTCSDGSSYFDRLTQLADRKRVLPDKCETESAEEEVEEVGRIIEHDLHCVKCGYNLRALSISGACPECGGSIADSLVGDRLSFSDPAWLKKICRGQTLVYAGCISLVSAVVFPALLTLANLDAVPAAILPIIFLAPWVLAVLLLGIGIYKVTAVEPRVMLTESQSSKRRWGRRLIVFLIVISCLASFGPGVISFANLPGTFGVITEEVLVSAIALSLAATVLCLCHYLADLAERIPDEKLAKKAKRSSTIYAACVVIALVSNPTWGLGAIGILGALPTITLAIASLVAFLYFIRILSMMTYFRIAFGGCLDEATRGSEKAD